MSLGASLAADAWAVDCCSPDWGESSPVSLTGLSSGGGALAAALGNDFFLATLLIPRGNPPASVTWAFGLALIAGFGVGSVNPGGGVRSAAGHPDLSSFPLPKAAPMVPGTLSSTGAGVLGRSLDEVSPLAPSAMSRAS